MKKYKLSFNFRIKYLCVCVCVREREIQVTSKATAQNFDVMFNTLQRPVWKHDGFYISILVKTSGLPAGPCKV
jgi:hypothetical protein